MNTNNPKGERERQPSTTAFSSSGKGNERSHILVAVQELGIQFGGRPNTVRREVLVDIGNAKNQEDAEVKAKARAAKKWHTNVVCLQVSAVRIAEPVKQVWRDSAVDSHYSYPETKTPKPEPVQQFVQAGPNFFIKVRTE